MAKQRGPGGEGAGRRRRGGEVAGSLSIVGRGPEPAVELDQLLDAIEDAVARRDEHQTQALSGQLWARRRQVPEALVERLLSGRMRLPGLALELLTGFGGTRAPTHLRRIAESAAAPDIVRWGARRRAGWPQRGEAKARRSFLQSLRDPEATLVEALASAGSWWPPDGQILQEVLDYVAVLPPEQRLALARRAIDEQVPEITWWLHSLVHVDDPALQHLVIAELVRLRDAAASGALSRLSLTTRDPALRAEASAAERRVRLHLATPSTEQPAGGEQRPWLPLVGVMASEVDGDGGQALMLIRSWSEQVQLLVSVFAKDTWGIKDVFGISRGPAEQISDIVADVFEEHEVHLVDIDLPAARGILAAAVQANAAAGHLIPPGLEVWEPLFHDTYPPLVDELVVVPELDDSSHAGRHDLVRQSAKLFQHASFESWLFNPEEIDPLLPWVPPPRGGRPTDQQYRPLIKGLVDAGFQQRLRQRLRRQAWLLERQGAREERDLALAVAASLVAEPEALVKHPFLRAMIDRSLVNLFAGLRLE